MLLDQVEYQLHREDPQPFLSRQAEQTELSL
jgi:hypothetical protein